MKILGALLAVNLLALAYFITQLSWPHAIASGCVALVLISVIRADYTVDRILDEELPPEDWK